MPGSLSLMKGRQPAIRYVSREPNLPYSCTIMSDRDTLPLRLGEQHLVSWNVYPSVRSASFW
ncbi:hypothetical protein EYF80_024677 [Liparis tanakae]|uniref:Uncharacterized protein n=1 Tax=Liparis tanakae TaxID=230148 RepID=A0A4Z2HGR6_9TELE|nr:hypothetical protein EYF80_024677 [Liparis tanakae]